MTAPSSTSPDALYASPRFRAYTLSGADVDIFGDGGGPCRAIKLLNTASGSLTLQPTSPISSTEAIDVTNLQAGDVLDVQATKIVSGLSGLKVLVLW